MSDLADFSRPEERFSEAPWVEAPYGIVPGVVALELLLARSDKAAVCIRWLAAYPTGFQFELVTMSAPGERELELAPFLYGRPHIDERDEARPAEMLRVSVQFADGREATSASGLHHDGEDPPAGPVLEQGSGEGGRNTWREENWVWPLPPPGPLAFVCEWPAADIALTRQHIDAQLILDAAKRSQAIFSDQPSHRWTSYGPIRAISPKPQPHGGE